MSAGTGSPASIRSRLGGPSAVLAIVAALGAGACGDHREAASATAFGQALDTIGEAVSPAGTGFGWVDIETVRATGRIGKAGWAAGALGPGADHVLEEGGEIAARTGLDPAAGSEALSVGGSYAFGVRVDGVAPGGLERLYREAGAATGSLDGWTAFDVGNQAQAVLDSRLEVFGAFAARAALEDEAVILARTDDARQALAGGGSSPLSDPGVSFAVRCLGDVIAARTLDAAHTYNAPAAPDLIAVGVRAPSASGHEEVICALDDAEDAVGDYASALGRTLGPGGRDVLTKERFEDLVASATVDVLEEGGLHAARAVLAIGADREPGLVLEALVRGSVLTYLGAPEPVPDD